MRISMYSRHGYIMYTLLTQTLKKKKKKKAAEKKKGEYYYECAMYSKREGDARGALLSL